VRIIEIALFVLVFQFSLGLVMVSGFVDNGFAYDSNLYTYSSPEDMEALNEWEQIGASVSSMNEAITKIVSWTWIKDYTQPYYSQNAEVFAFVNFIIVGLNLMMGVLIGGALIEFWIKQHKVI